MASSVFLAPFNQTLNTSSAVTFASLTLTGLPTEDPHVVGELWSDNGVVTVSAG